MWKKNHQRETFSLRVKRVPLVVLVFSVLFPAFWEVRQTEIPYTIPGKALP